MLKKVVVVIPVYNNMESLIELTNRIRACFEKSKGVSGSILFVDDRSLDNSWNVITEIARNNSDFVRALRLTRNSGQLAALYAGFENAVGEAIICMSADLQDPPELINELLLSWFQGYDLVAASRSERKDGFWPSFTSRIAYRFLKNDLQLLPEGGFDFFLMDDKVRIRILQQKGRHRFLQGEVLQASKNPTFINYVRLKRRYGKSQYNLQKRISNFLDASTDSSYGFIRKLTILGFLMIIVNFLLIFCVSLGAILGKTPFEGFLLLSLTTISFSTVQIFLLGIILEFIWRIYDINRGKKFFEIDQSI